MFGSLTKIRGPSLLVFWAVALALVGVLFWSSIEWAIHNWTSKEEYSHGILIPFVTLYLLWQRRYPILQAADPRGSGWGVLLILAGLAGLVLGQLSTVFFISHYALLSVLIGLVLSAFGASATRYMLMPLLLLALVIPLPVFLYNQLSTQLQLVSSWLGVEIIRACDISVFLEGNVIDLGTMKLQVVEACNGLRYLFPLVSLAFICAYLFEAPLWQRALVLLSSLPITVVMNSVRIGFIGVMVEYFGPEQAEGFLHAFEGWVIFMICAAILLAQIWVLATLVPPRRRFRECFGLEQVAPRLDQRGFESLRLSTAFATGVALLSAGAIAGLFLETRSATVPERRVFAEFPLSFADWRGHRDRLDPPVIDTLKFDDYLLADYRRADGLPVNLYVAYYGSQGEGQSAHSPRSCIPGGGWRIEELRQVAVPLSSRPEALAVNRVLIRKGDHRQLIYYWFDQRGRNLTSEFAVKWYLFWDGLTRGRSDGALLRLSTVILPDESLESAEQRLVRFANDVEERLTGYLPGGADG
ncbi:MAG: VPLPA-CTERM-specific exosortase XrtD [Pseudomonadota bacterium]|nr:VPLPA-CTERM-specific exosortase XrtD [Pseudomonadota bacterium]